MQVYKGLVETVGSEMAESEETVEEAPKKASKLPMIIGLVLALAGGGGGFYAVSSGMILGEKPQHEEPAVSVEPSLLGDIVFVPVEPMVVSINSETGMQHLRFRAQLEVTKSYQDEVELLLPRVVDVLNSYLRALKTSDLHGPAVLVRLRSQMLRRIQIVTGPGKVKDLLVMEFVLN